MKSRRKYPTQKRLQELFTYCPSGQLVRRNGRGNNRKTTDRPYRMVDGVSFYEHVLIFVYHHGFRPPVVDHKDRNTQNNKIDNLRASTVGLNSRNRTQNKNKTGVRGVYKETNPRFKKKFRVTIYSGKSIHVGNFNTLREAKRARQKAEFEYYGEVFT